MFNWGWFIVVSKLHSIFIVVYSKTEVHFDFLLYCLEQRVHSRKVNNVFAIKLWYLLDFKRFIIDRISKWIYIIGAFLTDLVSIITPLLEDVIYAWKKRYKLCCTLILLTYQIRDVILLQDVRIEINLDYFLKKRINR